MSAPNVSNVDWNLLLVLHTVLEEGSATRAAKRLSVTQSAVSNALARLRSVLDDPLFVRVGNQLVPTPRARALAPRLRVAVGEISEVLAPARAFDAATSTRRFVVAASDDVELWLLAPLVEELARHMPRAGLRVVTLDAASAARGLGTGEIDALVSMVESVPPGCAAEELCEDQIALLVRRSHPLSGSRAKPSALAVHPRIRVDSSLDAARALDRALAPHASAAPHVSTFCAGALAVAASDAILALPRRAAKALADAFSLRVLSLDGAQAPLSTSLVWHARSDAEPGAARLREIVRVAAGARPAVLRGARARAKRARPASPA
jgi:DNA-binding transcriptional LysR family regulator